MRRYDTPSGADFFCGGGGAPKGLTAGAVDLKFAANHELGLPPPPAHLGAQNHVYVLHEEMTPMTTPTHKPGSLRLHQTPGGRLAMEAVTPDGRRITKYSQSTGYWWYVVHVRWSADELPDIRLYRRSNDRSRAEREFVANGTWAGDRVSTTLHLFSAASDGSRFTERRFK